jgi:hypothetical protein
VQVQQLLAELVPVLLLLMMMVVLTQVVMDCEMQATEENHELGFDGGNHIQYHTPNYNIL